ncbi:MAG: hypothetical protein IJ711_13420 [Lachnospiraceae bacterium]|nr:hypothetical protein [Lachnospiraceae bacterium]
MNSIWFQEYEKKVQEELEKLYAKPKVKRTLIIAGTFFLILIGIAVYVGATVPDYDPIPAIGFVVFLAAVSSFAVLSKSKDGVNKDVTKRMREHLDGLLTTPEQTEEFDAEMMAPPSADFECGDSDHIYFTNHYIYCTIRGGNMPPGMCEYRFARHADVKELRFAASKDQTKVYGMGRLYDIDLLTADRKKLLGLTIHGKKKMEEFEALISDYCPGIVIQKHGLLS